MKSIRLIALIGLSLVSVRCAFAASYYLNDGSTSGDVYTLALGNDVNSGASPFTPKRSLTNLLTTINLLPNDIVYIDTGVYSGYTSIITNSGTAGNRIIFQGSTNVVAGGTVINRNNVGLDVIGLKGDYLEFRNLTVMNGRRGFDGSLQFPPPVGLVLDRVTVSGSATALHRGKYIIRRSLFINNTKLRDTAGLNDYDFENCVIYGCESDTTNAEGPITLNNSVYVGGDLLASITGDYNIFWNVRLLNQNRAYIYEYNMPNSTFADPAFANPAASNFYPKSLFGRFDPTTGGTVTDTVRSLLIDFGNPASTGWTNEPAPTGDRINAGAFGGTSFASRSCSNAWVYALTFSDGGAVTGTVQTLVWNYGEFTNATTVSIQYSSNDGISWSNIAVGVSVSNRSVAWNVSALPPMVALWRVVVENNTNISSRSRQPFSVGGVRVPYYLNDSSTNGTFYTTAAGSDLNDGLSPKTPKRSLTNLLSNYIVGQHDIIYVDTGFYSNYTTTIKSYGVQGQPLIIQGAPKAGASVFSRNGGGSVFEMLGNYHILRNLTLRKSTGNGAINGGIVTLENSIVQDNTIGFRRVNLTARNSVLASNDTVIVSDTESFTFDRCVFWKNGQTQSSSRPWSVSNSVVVGGMVNGLSYVTGADYTMFWGVTFDGYPNLSELQRISGKWTNSTVLNPIFSDPDNGNFYPKSVTGRYNPDTSMFVTDASHSPVIDFGNPFSTAYTNETGPNGNRLNAGVYGGTPFASKSRTNAWLQVLSLNDGGQLNVTTESVNWNYGNLPTGATVRIEFSFNSGFSWNTVGTNVSAGAGTYPINVTNFPSSLYARWRVVLESNPTVLSSNANDFTYRNGPFVFYVNDASTAGDVYCTAPGNNANLGTTPDFPKATLSGILTNYTLTFGDVVYVDTGIYQSTATIPVTLLASGTNGNPVVIQGSQNNLAGGTVIRGPASGATLPGFTFDPGVQDIDLRDLTIQKRNIGVLLNGNTRITLERVRIESNSVAGISASSVTGLIVRKTTIRANNLNGLAVSGPGDVSVLNSVIWMNGSNAVYTTGTKVQITNTVLGARGPWVNIYSAPTFTNIIANYNFLYVEQNASAARINALDRSLNTLSAWQAESGMDLMSLDCDPQFVNPEAGDFHLRSQTIQGRFDPVLGWVTDTITSPLIDAGDPTFPYSNETAPNGGRINIGLYGNDSKASRADVPRIFAGNLSQGGFVKGTSILHWVAGGLASNELIKVDVSVNGGETWSTLATGVLASVGKVSWNTTTNPPAVAGLWRASSVSNPSLVNQTTNFFGIRNTALNYFVNDGSIVGSQFTTGPGAATNWVASSNRPLSALSLISQRYDLEPGDRVFVDRGIYSAASPFVLGANNSGAPTAGVVTIIGATTCPGGATPAAELVGSGGIGQTGILIDQARHIVISNLTIRNVGMSLRVDKAQNVQIDGFRSINTATNSVWVNLSEDIEFQHSVFSGSSGYGWYGTTNIRTRVVNSMFTSNVYGSLYVSGGSLGITNSVILVDQPQASGITVENGTLKSDYNNIRVDQLANVARKDDRLHKSLAAWQQATTNDLHSLSHDPGFYNAGSGDYHLLSSAGRYDSGSCAAVTDSVTSVMIDAGDPSFGPGKEPVPNGNRHNIGPYGGSPEASGSPTNGRLLVLTLNSGGTIRGTNTLYWSANNTLTGALVYIDVSLDNGVTWTNIGTNISALAQSIVWHASAFESSALGRWRIVVQNNSLIFATNEVAFTLKNGSIGYFVNDASTTGDVYSTAVGLTENDGLSEDTPVDSVEAIFSRYQLGPGDIVYIDTGNYEFGSTVNLDFNNSGVITNPVVIQGSTNLLAGGSRFNMKRQGPLFDLLKVNAITFSDLILTNARYGFVSQVSSNLSFNRVIIAAAANVTDTANEALIGILLESSSDISIDRTVIFGVTNRSTSAGVYIKKSTLSSMNPGPVKINNSIMWSNTVSVWATIAAPVSISNSVIHTIGKGSIGIRMINADTFSADYNDYRIDAGAQLAELKRLITTGSKEISMAVNFSTVQAWRNYTGRDQNSLTYDPGLAAPLELDFGLLSTGGRWTPAGVVTDATSSVLIDAGNPSWAFSTEPVPNGNRVNMGHYANSSRASKTPTNRAVVMRSLHDGGIAKGTNVMLRWDLRGDFSGKTFRIQWIQLPGTGWQTITSGVPAGQLSYAWDSTTWPSGFNMKWRLWCEQEPAVRAESEKTFAIRNTNFVFYVNDSSVTGDVYTTAIGFTTNSGLSAAQPKTNLYEIINTYDLVGGDTVYIDTGIYPSGGNITISPRDEFSFPGNISFVGSTNFAAGGATLQNGGFSVENARDTVFKYFTISGQLKDGVSVGSSTNIQFEWIRIAQAGIGLSLEKAVNVQFQHSSVVGAITNAIKLSGENRFVSFDQGVIWNNIGPAVNPVNSISISNSVLGASGSGRFIYSGSSNQAYQLNYNLYFVTNGARIARISSGQEPFPREFATLTAWRNIFTQADSESMAGDPLFANPNTHDFHPRSTGGRWSDSATNFVLDAVTSPLVDSGDPVRSFAVEPAPNGERLNIGIYGNSSFSSKSPTNSDYLLVRLNDGGSVSGTNVILSWVARGAATGHTAKIEVSVDGGQSWSILASNVPPAISAVSWNTTGLTSTVVGLWRITSEPQPSITSIASRYFAIRNGPVSFYVNDGSVAGDVYSTSNGSSSALGISPGAPIDSLSVLLNRYDIEPGDIIYMDTGIYSNNASIVIDQLDRGFKLLGSTNVVAGGTRLAFPYLPIGIQIIEAPNTQLDHIRIDSVPLAITVQDSPGIILSSLQIKGANTGIQIAQSTGVTIRNSSIVGGDIGIQASGNSAINLSHLVIWSNRLTGVKLNLSKATMQNSIMGVFGGSGSIGIDLDLNSTWSSEFNMYDRSGDAIIARRPVSGVSVDLQWQRVATWSLDTGNDIHSLAGDPGFADRNAGDFHLRSKAGRYNVFTGVFTNDATTSVLIDAGSVQSAFSSETEPNGNRVNIGMYGNTYEASRSPTNSMLKVARLNDGGRAEGSLVPLTWVSMGAATGHSLRIEASLDDGASWTVIQSNVSANAETLFWDTKTNAAWFGRWRIISEQEPGISSMNAAAFAVRNTGLSLYMNDDSNVGDIYTTVLGNNGNTGTKPEQPRATLQSLLDSYDLEPGDTIYVDTGEYLLNSAVAIGRYDAWNAMNNLGPLQAGGTSLRIKGSTNDTAEGARFIRYGGGNAFELLQAFGVNLSNLRIIHDSLGGGNAIDISSSPYVLIERCRLARGANGVSILSSDGARIRHVLARNKTQHGVWVRKSVNVDIQQSVLWSNTVGLTVEDQSSVQARNNALVALAPDSTGWQRNDGPSPFKIGELNADFNLLWAAKGAFVAELEGNQYPAGRRRFQKMANWNEATGLDFRSIAADPLFADPLSDDFHPQSLIGRYDDDLGYITNITDKISPLIDTGDPTLAFTQETSPNGQRVNMGLYGNSNQSSLSPTNGILQALTFRDGGSSSGDITLRWAASGLAASHLVTLEYSNDGGATWTKIVSNVVASTQTYLWDSVPYGRAAAGLWRIYSQSDSNVISQIDTFFALRQGGSIPYYVNDGNVAGDVYCTAVGNDANNGFLPSSPKATLQALLDDDNIDLEPGDVVYMDTGVYSINLNTVWGEFDSGSSTNPVILRGSTNFLAGGTVMNRITGLGSPLLISKAEGVRIQDMTFINGSHGLSAEFAPNLQLYNVIAKDNTLSGFRIAGTYPATVENCLIWNNITNGIVVGSLSALQQGETVTQPGGLILRNSMILGSENGVRVDIGGAADVRNNLIWVNGINSRVYYLGLGQTVDADYNAYYRESGALMGERLVSFGGNEYIAKLIDWQRDSGSDLHSLSHNPLVANLVSGDFHLISASGRYLPSGLITNDPPGSFSPLIDTGDPATIVTNEAAPNGGRVNIGRYGNTEEASLSNTNGWLLALTLNDGGRITGLDTIRWAAGNWSTSSTVRLEYANDGVDYSVLASNVPVYQLEYVWDVSAEPITQLARWQVISEDDPTVYSAVQSPFIIKPEPLIIYVNDGSTAGDVYTTAEGSSTNSGKSAFDPLNDPGVALDRYPFSEGDVIYIDTGDYTSTNQFGLRLGLIGDTLKTGLPGQPIRVIGSTNLLGGGTRITSFNGNYGFNVSRTKHISLENMSFAGFDSGVLVDNSEDVSFSSIVSYMNDVGFEVDNVIDARFDRCTSWNNDDYGLTVVGDYTSATWDHGVLWNNKKAAIRSTLGQLDVYNSILAAALSNSLIYEINSQFTSINGDFNIYSPRGNKVLMYDLLGGISYFNMRRWQRDQGMDTNSFVADPLFNSPGAGDFHVMSRRGRYVPAISGYVMDSASSWAIDAGVIGSSFTNEPAPNGGRLNIGLYGDSYQASLSPTNRKLFVVSLRDGGTAASPQPLIWLTSGLSTTDTVRIDYTPNDGVDWYILATNVSALSRTFTWFNSELASTPLARWRISLESDSSISDTSAIHVIRNGPISYFVNDTNVTGDVYTLAPGSILNSGITNTLPVASVQTIIDRFELEGGDTIYVDTGYYVITNNIVIRSDDSGLVSSNIVIRGSTNRLAGGSRYYRTLSQPWSGNIENTNSVFQLILARNIEISHFVLENANSGIFVHNAQPQSSRLFVHDVEIRNGGFFGIRLQGSFDNVFERVLIHRMAWKGIVGLNSSAAILSSVIWSNQNGSVGAGASTFYITNSVLHAYGPITNAVVSLADSQLIADYNDYVVQGEAAYLFIDEEPITGLPQWTKMSTQDLHTISVDPLFANPASNNFYPLSPSGRFNPVTMMYSTNDLDYSWLIDTGNPGWSFTNEPSPNGSRINTGLYGNTPEASKSRTQPWVLAVTAMAGGRIGNIFPIHWFYGNLDSTNLVNLDFSADGGTNWYAIASNLTITADGYLWNSLNAVPFNQSPITKWRVTVAGNTNIVDETDTTFGLNGPFKFFINDTQTVNDVYTTAIGNDSNLGISSNAPKATLRAILDSWDIDPEDYIYVDTGNYVFQSNDYAIIRINNRGEQDHPVVIVGSTNGAVFDGSALVAGESVSKLVVIEAPFIVFDRLTLLQAAIDATGTNIVMRDINIQNGSIELNGQYGVLESFIVTNGTVKAIGDDIQLTSGYVSDGSLELKGARALLEHTVVSGVASPLVEIAGTNVYVINNTLVGSRTAIKQTGADSRSFLRNNILVADGALGTAFAIERNGGVVESDYNLFYMRNGAWYGNAQDGLWERLIYWQARTGGDEHSISDVPLFANEAIGNFRLKSMTGRYSNGVWAVDAVHSAAIDAGNPTDDYANETAPNGSRINIGAYGNTVQASRSKTSPWLYAVTMNDGGVIRGTNYLRWIYGAMDPTNRVMLQYSANSGTNWVTIVSNLPVNNGEYLWNTATAPSTLNALWRVVLEANPSVVDQVDTIFNIRNDVRSFYVNDAVTSGDVFSSAPGSPLNDGLSPATPKASLEGLLATYDTEAFDTVYVDTGVYTSPVIQVIWSRSGSTNGNMTIRGSTNTVAGGSVIRRPFQSGSAVILNASYVTMKNLIFENGNRGLLIQTNRFALIEEVIGRSNQTAVAVEGGDNHTIRSSIMRNNNIGIDVKGSSLIGVKNITFVNNEQFSLSISNTQNATVQNNIFYHDVFSTNNQAAIAGDTGTVNTAFIDYNVYYFGPLSPSARIFGNYTELLPWQRERSKDYRSAITNPLFASVSGQSFYLRSEAGRYNPLTKTFVNDTNTSWAIDKGNPYSDFSREPEENGDRINIGAYGNTAFASIGQTNQIVFARTGNGNLSISESENPYPLIWYVLNLPYDLLFSVQYSGDDGTEWVTLQSGISAYQEYIIWTNSPTFNSFKARWRVVGIGPGNTNYWDINNGTIKTFFGTFKINDVTHESGAKARFTWRGAWDENYQLQYAEQFHMPTYLLTNIVTTNALDFTSIPGCPWVELFCPDITNDYPGIAITNLCPDVLTNYCPAIAEYCPDLLSHPNLCPTIVTNLVRVKIESGGYFDWTNLGSVTNLVLGGDTKHTDAGSTGSNYRVYRVIWLGTNGVPYQ